MFSMIKPFHIAKIASSYMVQIANLSIVFFLTASEYGELSLIIAFAQLLFVLSAGISNGALINIGTREFIKEKTYHDIVVYRYIFVVLSICFILIFYNIFYSQINSFFDVAKMQDSVLLLAFSYVLYELSSQLLYPGDNYKKQSYIELVIASIFLFYVIYAVRSIELYLDGYLFISLLGAILTLIFYIKGGNVKKFKFKLHKLNEVFSFSLWQIISVSSIYGLSFGYNYLLLYYDFSNTDIGVFNFTLKLFLGMSGLFSLALILMPRMIHSNDGVSSHFHSNLRKIVILLTGLYLIACGCVYMIINFFERYEYLPSVGGMLLLTPAFMLMAYSNLLNTAFSNTILYKKAQIVTMLQAISMFLVAYFTLLLYGMDGLILAYTVSYLIGAIYSCWIFEKNRFLFENIEK